MKLSNVLIVLLTTLFIRCDNSIDYDKGPCKFAPPESNFPVIASCDECFFNLKFQSKEYSFAGNKIASDGGSDYTQMKNTFLAFYLDLPNSDERLKSSIDIKTPLVKVDATTKLNNSPPLVSTAFGIYNYCNDFFQPITDDISQSYHQLTKTELIESYPAEINSEPYQLFYFYLSGELNATFVINGDTQIVTAQYRVKSLFFEKL